MWSYVDEIEVTDEMMSACYALILGEEVVYVGKSTNVMKRLGEHLRLRKAYNFDRIRIYYTSADNLGLLERSLIARLRPRLNVHGKPAVRFARYAEPRQARNDHYRRMM